MSGSENYQRSQVGNGPRAGVRDTSTPVAQFKLHIAQTKGFELETTFDKEHYPVLRTDEPAPLSSDTAPNPARILAAAIGECLSASFVFCAKKAGTTIERLKTEVDVEIVRNEDKRLRVGKIAVRIDPNLPAGHPALTHCVDLFEDFCTVTESVRSGIPIAVEVASE